MPTNLQPQMMPFNFGPAGHQLFGLYHTPEPGQEREFGVLICNPWGQEYVRAHRAVLQLGTRLARQGFPVLRFDYYATGDSAGDDEEGSLQQWQADVRTAITELKRRARVESIYLAGLRLGATLAALVASGRYDVEGVVLWEPAVLGSEYLSDLTAWHEEKQFYFLNQPQQVQDQPELLGFRLGAAFQDELSQVNLLEMKRKPAPQVLVIESTASTDLARGSVKQMCQHFEALGAVVDYQLIESFKMWVENPDKGLVPLPILECAVNWLVRKAAV